MSARADAPRMAASAKNDGGRAREARTLLILAMLAGAASTLAWPTNDAHAGTNVAATVHNLSPSGPGKQKDGRAAGTCAYCHTPHNASPTQALWSRASSGITYQLYTSASMQASVDQPTGSSRLCLSCHDGLLALSSARIAAATQADKPNASPLTGASVIGTDLRASHPSSFTYDSALAARRGELADPKVLPSAVRLDAKGQLQCTSCHDPHQDTLPKFLRMDNAKGSLCLACHRLTSWSASSHATSAATWNGTGTNPFPTRGQPSVAANGCNNCHRSHAAGHGERLLARASEPENCTLCHNGSVAKKNVAAEFAGGSKISRHPIEAAQWSHTPKENPASMPRHVTCVDCHNPHQASAAAGADAALPGPLQGVAGVTSAGTPVSFSNSAYQVCLKCHGESSSTGALRADRSRNIRDKVSTGSTSFHPVAAAARNPSARKFVQGYSSSSVIGCTDCHNNSDHGDTDPKGPHASRFSPILERNYVTTDPAPESPSAYAMCYKCHDRSSFVTPPAVAGPSAPATARAAPAARIAGTPVRSASTFGGAGFPHWLHVVKNQTSCATCHDAHGSRTNPHLINFMTRDTAGRTVVSANSKGRMDYLATAPGQGQCNLSCHGRDHSSLGY